MSDSVTENEKYLLVDVKDTKESFRRTRVLDGPDPIVGKFWFVIEITAVARDIYIPISIASSKKPTGFVYQIEGTVQGFISRTDIYCRGEDITQITLGTLVYCKIPAGLTASFHIRIEMKGQVGKSYRTLIRQINFKLDPNDVRYQKLAQGIHTKMLKFS